MMAGVPGGRFIDEVLREVRRWAATNGLAVELAVLFGAVGLLVAVDYWIIRPRIARHRRRPPAIAFVSGGGETDPFAREEWVVVCRHCRAQNQFGYQYCSNCLAPLPRRVVKAELADGQRDTE